MKEIFVHIEFLILLLTLVGGTYTISSSIRQETYYLKEEVFQQAKRTDELYNIIIDMLKK